MSRAIPLLLLHAFTAWRGTTLPLPFSLEVKASVSTETVTARLLLSGGHYHLSYLSFCSHYHLSYLSFGSHYHLSHLSFGCHYHLSDLIRNCWNDLLHADRITAIQIFTFTDFF
jgi:hypothetical protein